MIDESLGYMGSPMAVSTTKTYGGGSNGFGHMATTASSSSGGSSKGMNSGYHGGSSSSSNGHSPPHSSFSDHHPHHVHISIDTSNGESGNISSTASSSNGAIAFKTADISGRSVSTIGQGGQGGQGNNGGGGTSGKNNSKPGFGVGALVTIIRSVFGNSVFLGCTAGI